MIRALTVLATAALALPVGHYIDDALGTGAKTLGASVALAAPGDTTDEADASAEVSLVYRDGVAVGEDGSGVRAARFATGVAGRDVGYVLLIENGCASSDPLRRCPAPVREVTVTLNGDVVFQNEDDFKAARREVALNAVGADDNTLVIAARGAPGSAARVRVLAVRQPEQAKPKPAVLGLLHRGAVKVGEDGSGVRAARFATGVAGRDVGYVLLIENGCASSDPLRRCPAPVREVTVTLNGDVVFQNEDDFKAARREVALDAVGADDNTLVIAARGAPGSAARVRVLAVRQPEQAKPKPAVLGLLHRGAVKVGEDGSGVRAARFATGVAGRDVGYVLLIENGCASSDPLRRCPAPVREVTVTLNGDVVFQNEDDFKAARREVALNAVGADDNTLVIAARGAPGSAARVRVLAVRQPEQAKPKPVTLNDDLVFQNDEVFTLARHDIALNAI